jgi:hypothetical protein
MNGLRIALSLALVASTLTGCGSLKKFTGQRNDTVLPGEREDILPADQQVNPRPSKADDLAADSAKCDPAVDANCAPGVDQEAPAAEDIQ